MCRFLYCVFFFPMEYNFLTDVPPAQVQTISPIDAGSLYCVRRGGIRERRDHFALDIATALCDNACTEYYAVWTDALPFIIAAKRVWVIQPRHQVGLVPVYKSAVLVCASPHVKSRIFVFGDYADYTLLFNNYKFTQVEAEGGPMIRATSTYHADFAQALL